MKLIKKLVFRLSGLIAPAALALAVMSVNSTCFYYTYQPDVPDELSKYTSPHRLQTK